MQNKLAWDPDVLEPIFRSLYTLEMKDKKDFIPLMFGLETSQKDTESVNGLGGEGLMEEWGQSGNSVHYEDIEELWDKRFKHKKFSLGRVIERDFIDDLKLTEIKDRIKGMADAVYKTRQYQAVEFLNNAFATSAAVDYKGRVYNASGVDGKALCATDHPYSPTNSTDTQGNKGTSALDWNSWDATSVLMQQWVDDKGNLMGVTPDTIIVAPYNMAKAFQIAGLPSNEAKYVPGSPNFSINVYEGQLKVIVNPFLKDKESWFAVDSARMKKLNKWFDRRKPEYGSVTDFDTEQMKYKVIGRWSYGFVNYSFIYGHSV